MRPVFSCLMRLVGLLIVDLAFVVAAILLGGIAWQSSWRLAGGVFTEHSWMFWLGFLPLVVIRLFQRIGMARSAKRLRTLLSDLASLTPPVELPPRKTIPRARLSWPVGAAVLFLFVVPFFVLVLLVGQDMNYHASQIVALVALMAAAAAFWLFDSRRRDRAKVESISQRDDTL